MTKKPYFFLIVSLSVLKNNTMQIQTGTYLEKDGENEIKIAYSYSESNGSIEKKYYLAIDINKYFYDHSTKPADDWLIFIGTEGRYNIKFNGVDELYLSRGDFINVDENYNPIEPSTYIREKV